MGRHGSGVQVAWKVELFIVLGTKGRYRAWQCEESAGVGTGEQQCPALLRTLLVTAMTMPGCTSGQVWPRAGLPRGHQVKCRSPGPAHSHCPAGDVQWGCQHEASRGQARHVRTLASGDVPVTGAESLRLDVCLNGDVSLPRDVKCWRK